MNKSSLNTLNLRSYDGKIAGLYDLEETLGRGHYAVVKLAKHVFTGEKVAVKVIDKTKLDDVSKAQIFQEVRCMKLVQHPNVVRLYEVIDTQTKLYLILELGDGGDLYDYIMKHEGGLSENMAKKYFLQILRAISYCHRLHIVHRDLKPENVVFFEKQGLVKITDFGFSNKFYPGQKLETSCGSLAYSAPEILLGESYDAPAVDVWSLGVILYMLVCGSAPFQEANDSETLTMIMDCKYHIPDVISAQCKNLILRMLVRSPENRATLEQISNDSWLKNADEEARDDSYYLPLVSRQQISEEDHNMILQKMENGKIATKEEIAEALEKNPYDYVTSTYYLLAERTLRLKRHELINKKRPNLLTIPKPEDEPDRSTRTLKAPTHLQVPRTPGDTFQRIRKCSIVQEEEDEDEEDILNTNKNDLESTTMNRRCSKSESKLNDMAHDKNKDNEIPISQTTTLSDQMTFLNLSQTLSDKKPHSLKTRLRFHKPRANSYSSSEASDDDKPEDDDLPLNIKDHKPVTVFRRDSQDDSSDSQDACSGGGTSSTTDSKFYKTYFRSSTKSDTNNNNNNNNSNNNNNEKKKSHLRRSNVSEIKLKESLSLNRIAEVQEDVYLGRPSVSKKVLPISLSVHCYSGSNDHRSSSGCSSSSNKKEKGCRNAVRRINATFGGFFKYNLRKTTRDSSATIVTYVDRRLNMLKKFQRGLFTKQLKSNVF